jgi:hypothetical protein
MIAKKDVDRLADNVSDGLTDTLTRIRALAAVVIILTGLIGVATFATGLWVFDGDGRIPWLVIGGALCAIPIVAASVGWFFVRGAAKAAPKLLDEVHSFLGDSFSAASTLIDHDSGKPLAQQAKTFTQLRAELKDKRDELPALFGGVRAISSVPGLAAVAVLGSIGIGALGTFLLIAKLID